MTCCFDYDRVTLLNAAYDVFEALGIEIICVNSENGMISFKSGENNVLNMFFMTCYPDRKTSVTFEIADILNMDAESGVADTILEQVILDEIKAALKNTYQAI